MLFLFYTSLNRQPFLMLHEGGIIFYLKTSQSYVDLIKHLFTIYTVEIIYSNKSLYGKAKMSEDRIFFFFWEKKVIALSDRGGNIMHVYLGTNAVLAIMLLHF